MKLSTYNNTSSPQDMTIIEPAHYGHMTQQSLDETCHLMNPPSLLSLNIKQTSGMLSGRWGTSWVEEAIGSLVQTQIHLPWPSQGVSRDVPCSTSHTVGPNKPFLTLTSSSQILGLIPTHQAKQPHLPFKGLPENWNDFHFCVATILSCHKMVVAFGSLPCGPRINCFILLS